ncbi:Pet127-domain-containing protein [Clavulina sp. PMI_390]|nr:Pet127-domain-containing protein [Clavulina sp. PMI_390]
MDHPKLKTPPPSSKAGSPTTSTHTGASTPAALISSSPSSHVIEAAQTLMKVLKASDSTSESEKLLETALRNVLQGDLDKHAPKDATTKSPGESTKSIPVKKRKTSETVTPVSSQQRSPHERVPHLPILRLKRSSSDPPVPTLAHGLERVLFNPAPFVLRDPHSHIYNFDPYLENIPPLADFDFDRLSPFTPSSKHSALRDLAKFHEKDFVGSTSSLTGLLAQIYFALTRFRKFDVSSFSSSFATAPKTFTPAAKMPVSIKLTYDDGVYSIDSDDDPADKPANRVLLELGTMLENFLIMPSEEFQRLKKGYSGTPPNTEQAYQFSLAENLVMRSQLDCRNLNLPGTGVFDLKTRAVTAVRHGLSDLEENSGYVIRKMTGPFESFEKERFDLLRSGMLEYFFQAWIGMMDGVFVAHHNTKQIFGFQYIPLHEMDVLLFGQHGVGGKVFSGCVGLLTKILEEIKEVAPHQNSNVIFHTSTNDKVLRIFVEPANTPSQVTELAIRIWPDPKQSPLVPSRTKVKDLHFPDLRLLYSITKSLPSVEVFARRETASQIQRSIGESSKEPSWDGATTEGSGTTPATTSWRRKSFWSRLLRSYARKGRQYTARLPKSRIMWNDQPGMHGKKITRL